MRDLFSGVVRRIVSVTRIEVTMDLPFDIAITRAILPEDLGSIPDDEETRDRVQHCLIVLLGGKNVAVQPAAGELDRWRGRSVLLARLYLNEKIHGEPPGYTPSLPGFSRPLLEVSPFLNHLAGRNFRVSEVREVVNGVRRGRTA